MFKGRKFEKILSAASFIMASVLAVMGICLHAEHDIAAGVAMVVAQFLTLTATLLGFDYKWNSHASNS